MIELRLLISTAALSFALYASPPAYAQNPCAGAGDTMTAACKAYLDHQKMLAQCEKNPMAPGCAEFLKKEAEKDKQQKQRTGSKQQLTPSKVQAGKTLPSDPAKKPTQGVGFHEVDEKPAAKNKDRLGIHEVDEKPAAKSKAAVGFNPQPDPMLGRGVIDPNQMQGLPGSQLPGRTGPCPRGTNC